MNEENKDLNLTLLDDKSMVREANELIEAKYILDTWEARIFHAAISQIKPSDEDFKKYKVYIKDIETKYGIKDKDMYRRIRAAAKSLRGKEIVLPYRYDEGMGHLVTGLITSYGGLDKGDGAFVMIELHPDLKPYLLMLKQRFTQYNLIFLMKMQSRYSRRIYKLLKQYQPIGKRKFSIERLRDLLCIEKNRYVKYSHFKRRVVLKAQEDLEEMTDIKFTFEEHKRGRSVAEITFFISRNTPTSAKLAKPSKNTKEQVISDIGREDILNEPAKRGILDKMTKMTGKWKVSRTILNKWLHEFGESQVMRAIEYTQKAVDKGEISNPGGYLNKMVRQTDFVDKEQERKKKRLEKKKKEQERAEKLSQLQENEKQIRRAHYEAKIQLVRKILTENPIIQEQVFNQVKMKSEELFDAAVSNMDNYDYGEMGIRTKVNHLIFQQFPDLFKPIDEDFENRVGEVRKEMLKI